MRMSDWSSDVCSSDLVERKAVSEGARVVLLVGRLREPVADMRVCDRYKRIGDIGDRPFIAARCRKLEFGHGGQAVAFTNAGGCGQRLRQGGEIGRAHV